MSEKGTADKEPLLAETPSGPAQPPAPTNNHAAILKYGSLGFLILQNSSHVLLLRYSRVVPGVCSQYVVSVAVLFAELLKLVFCLVVILFKEGGPCSALALLDADIWQRKTDTLKVSVPALCYTLQNNLWYHALSNLDPVTAAVTSQLKVFTTAIASVVMLGRRVNAKQWGALTLLMGGMILMQLKDGADSGGDEESEGGGADVVSSVPPRSVPQNTWHGALAMLGSTMLSA